MNKPDEERDDAEPEAQLGGCSCRDPFASLPADLRPKPPVKDDGLRQVTCPKCGLTYRTNRKMDECVNCE